MARFNAELMNRAYAAGFDILAHSMGNLLLIEAIRQLQSKGRFTSSGNL